MLIKKKYILITNLILFIFYFSISIFVPYQGDDFIFKVNPLEYSINYDSIIKAFQSQIYWYNQWTGRYVGLFFLTLLLLPKKIFFDIINSFIQVFLINIIFFLCKGRIAKTKLDSSIILLIHFLLFIGFYGYSTSVFNITFSINAIWTHTATLFYFIIFKKYWHYKSNIKRNFFFFIFGIIVGCGLEHVFIAQVYFFILLYILYRIKKILFLPKHTLYSFTGVIIGGLILMFAPGNFNRTRYSELQFKIDINSIIDYWVFELEWLINYIKPFWFILFFIFIIYFFLYKEKLRIENDKIIILSVGFISALSMSISPAYHNGINMFFYFCIIIFFLSLFNFRKIVKGIFLKYVLLIQILFLFIFNSYLLFNQLKIYDYATKLEEEILVKKNRGEMNIKVEKINLNTNRFINYMSLFDNPEDLRNQGIARYYNITSIQADN